MNDPILLKQSDESFNDYHIRLYRYMSTYGLDKYEVADLLNKEFGSNYDESKWRKDYAQYQKWQNYILTRNLDKEILEKYEKIRIESEKEKIRNQDQKREYRKMISESARFEKIRDDIKQGISQLEKKKPLQSSSPLPYHTDKEGLALFSDWHFGMEVDNTQNKFNKQVFDERVEYLVNKVIEYGKKNDISTLHVANLGDMLSGMIHVSTRVQSNEDLIEQVQYVSEVLSEVISILANNFRKVKYYNVIGNHGRAGNKHDVGLKENYEYLIPWYLEARLKDFGNVEIITDEDGYILYKIGNQDVAFVHGDFDRIDSTVTRLPQMTGIIPDYIFAGHIHHNYEKEYGKTTVVVNGSLIGVDDYATKNRFSAKPSQKFMVFDESGLECTYVIKLNQ